MTAQTSKKPKSPPAPARHLNDCFDDVKKAYEQYSHGTFTLAEFANVLGVSSGTGAFNNRMSAIRQFGLVESTGDKLKASHLFQELSSADPGSAGFKRAALKSIRGCDVFDALLTEFKDKLPQHSALAQRLEIHRKFNADRAKDVASVLEEALRWAGVLGAGNNILPVRDEGPSTGSRRNAPEAPRDEEEDVTDHDSRRGGIREQAPSSGLKIEVPLEGNRKVVIFYPADIKGDEAKKIGNVLTAIVG